MPTVIKNTITFDEKDWLGGLHPQSGEQLALFKNGYDSMIGVNPFESLGSVVASPLPVAVTNVALADGVINHIVPNTLAGMATIEMWGVGGTKLYRIGDLSGEIESGGGYPHQVASSVMEDVVRYNISGNEKILYSYNTASKGDIGMHDLASNFVDDYWTGTSPSLDMDDLNKDNPHPMIVGDDDILYIGDGNILKSIDGDTPVGSENALKLPSSFIIKSFAKIDNRTLVMFADQGTGKTTGQARAFFWDYVSSDPYRIYDLVGNEVGGANQYSGSVCVVTKGVSADLKESSRDFHLLYFNGSRFQTLFTIEAGDLPTTGGISVNDDYILINSSGNLYSYGTPFDGINAGPMSIHRLGGTKSGAVINSYSQRIIASSNSTSDEQLEIITGSGGYAVGTMATTYAEPINDFATECRVKAVRVEFLRGNTGADTRRLDIELINEKNEEIKVTEDLTTVDSDNRVLIFYSGAFVSAGFEKFTALQLYANWSGGTGTGASALAIRKVIVEYERINILN